LGEHMLIMLINWNVYKMAEKAGPEKFKKFFLDKQNAIDYRKSTVYDIAASAYCSSPLVV